MNVRVDFYPFAPRKSLQPYQLSSRARLENYRMFRYRLDGLPMVTLLDASID